MNLGNRLKVARDECGLTQEQVAKRISGITAQTISNYERGERDPDTDTLKTLSEIYKVSTDWLLFGEKVYAPKNVIPILGVIRAGIPLLSEDQEYLGQIEIPSDLNADFALQITGDSMSWVGIYQGDIAILREIDVPSHGMIVAAGVAEEFTYEATLKFYAEQNGKKMLIPANPNYEEIQITENHRIMGHVISIIKEPPSLNDYKSFLIPKEIKDQSWQKVIEKAANKKMDGQRMEKLFDLFADMIEKV